MHLETKSGGKTVEILRDSRTSSYSHHSHWPCAQGTSGSVSAIRQATGKLLSTGAGGWSSVPDLTRARGALSRTPSAGRGRTRTQPRASNGNKIRSSTLVYQRGDMCRKAKGRGATFLPSARSYVPSLSVFLCFVIMYCDNHNDQYTLQEYDPQPILTFPVN